MLLRFFSDVSIKAKDIGLQGSESNIGNLIAKMVTLMMTVVGALSVVFIVVGGLLIALSGGDPSRYKKGRETLLYAIVGLIVSIVAYTIVSFVSTAV